MQYSTLRQNSTKDGPIGAGRPRTPDAFIDEEQAVVVLDVKGTIQHITGPARRMLDLGSRTVTGQRFFPRVHPDHLNRVMWDLAEMAVRGRQHATWLLRLKTGLGPWQWFKLEATHRLTRNEGARIILRLFERGRKHGGEAE